MIDPNPCPFCRECFVKQDPRGEVWLHEFVPEHGLCMFSSMRLKRKDIEKWNSSVILDDFLEFFEEV